MKSIEAWDDVHAQRDKTKVAAVRCDIPLRFGDRSGELDLTEENYRELNALLDSWFAACHEPGQLGMPSQPRREAKAGGKLKREPADGIPPRVWRRDMRNWSDGLGLVNRDDPAYPAWQTTSGKHYYPADLEDAFTLHVQGREEEALAMVAHFRPRVAA